MPLGGDTELGRAAQAQNQSTDPVVRQERYNLITKTIQNGRGLMPAWGRGAEAGALLNDEQINELALMIQNVDWDLVYNEAIQASGGYPTFPPAPAPAGGAAPTPAPAATPQGAGGNAGNAATSDQFTIEAHDISFNPTEIEVPSDTEVTILLPNLGCGPAQLQHRRARHQRRHRPGRDQGSQDHRAGGPVRVLLQRPRSQGGGDGRHADLAADGVRRPAGDRGRERRRGRGPGHRRKRPARRRMPQRPRT